MNRALVCGGRDFNNYDQVCWVLDRLIGDFTVVIHGDARGADSMADLWARYHHKEVIAVPADWEMHGNSAGPIRNRKMLDLKPELVIAFPGGSGTNHMCNISRKAGIPVIRLES